MHQYRTHDCNQLTASDIGRQVRLSGWVHRKRDHGGLLFIDLRDHYGMTQCVIDPSNRLFDRMTSLSSESVIRIDGQVCPRPDDTANAHIATGQIEVQVADMEVLSQAEELTLPVFGEPDYPEDLRLAWRFLDLRRTGQHQRIVLRGQIISSVRHRMIEAGFAEYQTPILTAASPEGARDFVVPSRLHPGKFYALPQAPQIFKQLIMIAGFDRYFQIAPCFRDEDARADRSPGEFYQLDVEMSFVTQEDVFAMMEPLLHGLFEEFADGRHLVPMPFERIAYRDAMLFYGTDKPDLRNPIKIADVSECFTAPGVEFRAFRQIVEKGGVVRAIPAPGASSQPRIFFDRLNEWARKDMNAPGLGYMIFEQDGGRLKASGPIAKFIPAEQQNEIAVKSGAQAGDAVFFSCAPEKIANALAGAARAQIAEQLGLIDKDSFHFCWITDMPMFEFNEQTRKIDFSHNPFSMPQGGMKSLEELDPLDVLGWQYDIVCNGVELSSGALRNHDLPTLFKAFEIAGYAREQVEAQFGAMVRALACGAPPHGGIAPGLDRIVMLLAGVDNLRDVVMFPMNQQAEDLLTGAPGALAAERAAELYIRSVPPPPPQDKK